MSEGMVKNTLYQWARSGANIRMSVMGTNVRKSASPVMM